MKFDNFIGGSYQSQAWTADCAQTINWYPEKLEDPGASNPLVLFPTPGVAPYPQFYNKAHPYSPTYPGGGRAHFFQDGREFCIIGAALLEIDSGGFVTSRGTVAVDSNPATICSNGDGGGQLFITSGTNAYYYVLATNVLTQIAALNGKATMGDYLDGYFLALDTNTSTFYVSKLFDGSSWTTGVDFAQRSLAADNWRSMKVVGRYIWLLGEYTTEIWQDTGANFPFAPFPSTLIPYGIASTFAASVIGDSIAWLGNTRSGKKCVLLSTGGAPKVISNYPLESALAGYLDLSTTISDSYSDKGHTFFLLNFDQQGVTWAWDSETSLWHQRGTWDPVLHRFNAWRPRFYAHAFSEHRILDVSNGLVYRMSADIPTDASDPSPFTGTGRRVVPFGSSVIGGGGALIRRVRRAPALMSEDKRIFFSSFELDLEPGLGTLPNIADFSMSLPI